jgi:hypothetical protein
MQMQMYLLAQIIYNLGSIESLLRHGPSQLRLQLCHAPLLLGLVDLGTGQARPQVEAAVAWREPVAISQPAVPGGIAQPPPRITWTKPLGLSIQALPPFYLYNQALFFP